MANEEKMRDKKKDVKAEKDYKSLQAGKLDKKAERNKITIHV
ncbi:hypothetical protein SC499_14275 [Peribacillus simplex]|nr:hypothetical protein [Peribacillus simplex]MDW7615858.1 hypothetical protein [Peribacillus simplex]